MLSRLLNAATKETEDIYSRKNSIQTSSPYQDMGLIIDATNMAAGAQVASNWIDGAEWVRNILVFVTTDQQYDIIYQLRDSSGNAEQGGALASNQAASPGSHRCTKAVGTQALVGSSFKLYLKNSSASPNTFGKMRVQLMGA